MNNTTQTIFIDAVLCILAIFLILDHNPAEARDDDLPPPGSIVATIEWPPGNIDVDMWFRAPNDAAVGYSNKGGRYVNLLRDDLGDEDGFPLNFEVSYSRAVPAGEWVLNLHLFNTRGDPSPVPVHVEVMMKLSDKFVTIHKSDEVLTTQGQELTVIRFTLDDKGGVVGKSRIPTPLRSGARRANGYDG